MPSELAPATASPCTSCLTYTPPSLLLRCRSIFGENALANLSIEKPVDDPDSKVTGHIRIRAKSQVSYLLILLILSSFSNLSGFLPQGMALSLGDKISSSQKQSVQAA